MKSIWESSETFTAYATVDAGLYMMSKAVEAHYNNIPTDPVSYLVDKATGYGLHKEKELVKFLTDCLTDIIRAKKVIEADFENDLKLLTLLENGNTH